MLPSDMKKKASGMGEDYHTHGRFSRAFWGLLRERGAHKVSVSLALQGEGMVLSHPALCACQRILLDLGLGESADGSLCLNHYFRSWPNCSKVCLLLPTFTVLQS